jgi:class 3 adenylate cyclase
LEMKLLHLAANGDLVRVEKMICCNVSIHAADYNGRTSLHLAAERGHVAVVKYLLRMGADAASTDVFGETPCDLALKGGHEAVLDALSTAGSSAASTRDGQIVFLKAKRARNASFVLMEAFPQPIALAMLQGSKIEAVSKDLVSVLFSDIVGFTSISSTLDARKVSDLLNRLFRKFDRLAYIHGVQKIDVVGDAYIAATNFVEDQAGDHAARLARFAVAAMEAAADTPVDEDAPAGSGCVQIRIGIHCGPVSGNVVGSQNLKYTLMGETVNVASRMESTGLASRIQCSEASASLIRQQAHEMVLRRRWPPLPPAHPCARSAVSPPTRCSTPPSRHAYPPSVSRGGKVNVKGKGAMGTFWLSSLRHGNRAFGSCPNLSALDAAAAAAAAAPSPAESGPLSRGVSCRLLLDCPAPLGPAVAVGEGGGGSAGEATAARCASAPDSAARRSSVACDALAEIRRPPRPHSWLSMQSQIFRL